MHMKFKSHIQGLRALSIVSVLIYHLEISILNFKVVSGGFLGVDIFFVISGYVITSHILDRSLSIPLERQGQREQTRVNRLMKSLGYYQTRKQTADGFQSVWRLSNS